jgi:hypothetical protein
MKPTQKFYRGALLPILPTLILLGVIFKLDTPTATEIVSIETSQELSVILAPTAISPPFPTTPPDLTLVSVGEPDFEGFSTVNGAAGAVPAAADVIVVNLSAHNYITTTADTAGAFTASLYAPAGSSLLIKYETDGIRIQLFWQYGANDIVDATTENLNQLPGTILHVHPPPPGNGQVQEFATVGSTFSANPKRWSGWALTGTLEVPPGESPPGLRVQPGEPITITAHLRVTTPGVVCSDPVTFTVNGEAHLRYLFGGDGVSEPWNMWFSSYLFTPTGLPIEHEANGEWPQIHSEPFSPFVCTSAHTFEGTWETTYTLSADLPDGIYRPELSFLALPPLSTDIRLAEVWYHKDPSAILPPIMVGDPLSPRIPWTLLADYPVNGHRGLQAREDDGHFMMPTRNLFPPYRVVVPRLDERSGDPLAYRLEPGSIWLASTDRRLPPPPHIPLALPSGQLSVEVLKPDGSVDQLGPAPILQSSVRTPSTPGGDEISQAAGHIGELFHLSTMDDAFAYIFEQYGDHTVYVFGQVQDIYGNAYNLDSIYDVTVARILDIDPAQLPTTPYQQGDFFAPGLHVFPPVPADVQIELAHMPFSDPTAMITTTFSGQANRYGYFQPEAGTVFTMTTPGEFRVDYTASYLSPDGTLWVGTKTWGNVVEGVDLFAPDIEAQGRRGMGIKDNTIDDMPAWFIVANLPPQKSAGDGEVYYPYFSGDIHWGNETPDSDDPALSINPMVTLNEKPGVNDAIYDVLREHFPRATNCFRYPPPLCKEAGLEKRIAIGEAPLFITTQSGIDPAVNPDDIDLWGYWYGSSERPDVHVHEVISEDGIGTAYWQFNDTYGYQIGEPADGDQEGDIKWEFGGAVLRTITDTNPLNEYAIYASLWVLLPQGCDSFGCTRITPPFRGAGALDGGPIMSLLGEDIDMLFLPKGVRPGDILELGDTFSFSGHVGPPLDSRVSITVTTPSQNVITATWHANKIGWLYDPTFDHPVDEIGRWTVEVDVHHDRFYKPTGINPDDPPFNGEHNRGTVLGLDTPTNLTYNKTYAFYVVSPDAPRLPIIAPQPGYITWPIQEIEPIEIIGMAPHGTTTVHYTIHDKGVVMGQGVITPESGGAFTYLYDPEVLHSQFPMLSLTAREGRWEGLADEVAINFLAVGAGEPVGNTVTLIGEEVFIGRDGVPWIYLPVTIKAPTGN